MIWGTVNDNLEPIASIRVRGPGGVEKEIEALIDTGYTGTMTLPTSVIEELDLLPVSGAPIMLADGSIHRFSYFALEIALGEEWVPTIASEMVTRL